MDRVEAAVAAPAERPTVTLRLTADAGLSAHDPSVRLVVTDTAVTFSPDEQSDRVLIRDIAEGILAERDLFAEAAEQLDGWATASGIADRMTVDGTSYWYYVRLGQWMWLVDRLLDAAIIEVLLLDVRPTGLDVDGGVAQGIKAAARAAASHHGLAFRAAEGAQEAPSEILDANDPPAGGAQARPAARAASAGPTAPPRPPPPRSIPARIRGRLARALGRPPTDEKARRRALVATRIVRLATESGRLLVVLAHARQRIEVAGDARLINPYLGPIAEALRDSRLDPIGVETAVRLTSEGWDRIEGDDRLLPSDALSIALRLETRESREILADPGRDDEAQAILADIATITTPLLADGIDLGPELVERVVDQAGRVLPGKIRAYRQIRSLIRTLRPAGILVADEYHRQEWLAAAESEKVRSAAVQHGLIYRWHNGYIHRERPASLRLPDRTYVFGDWERRLLTRSSVYRPEEVLVGGSPRLDLVRPEAADAGAIRRQLGVAADDRLVVLSATWGPLYRTYLYPIALAGLFDRPLPRVHVVIKLHPSERDEGPYRAVIEGVARAGGFTPPPIAVVQDIDLYGLLAAADAHLGIHSTVLTEAVVTGTSNLIADRFRNADLLGYVEAGVATPVRTGADLLAALDAPQDREALATARQRFLDDHFEPGRASDRIAADLLAWLP